MSRRSVRKAFRKFGKKIVHVLKSKKFLAAVAIGAMFIPGVGGAVSKGIKMIPLNKTTFSTALKVGAIAGTSVVAYKGAGAVGGVVGNVVKSPITWVAVGGLAYLKLRK